ncbi:hypothetical protein Tco_1367974 [Tanacetum coccineum]
MKSRDFTIDLMEVFYEAWDRFNDLLRACPHHGFSELHQLDTFYNALNSNDQDSLNSAAGGNFLDKMPRDCLRIIESKSKFIISRKQKGCYQSDVETLHPCGISSDRCGAERYGLKALLLDKKNQSPAPTPIKAVEESCVTCGGAHSYQTCPATTGNVYRDNIQEYVSQAAAANYNQGNTRSNAPTNESSSHALVAQDGLGGYDWSNDFKIEPVNYALMAISSSSSSSSPENELQKLHMALHKVLLQDHAVVVNRGLLYHTLATKAYLLDNEIEYKMAKTSSFVVCSPLLGFKSLHKALHLNTVKRIFRYHKHQPKLGLWYPRDSPVELEAFLDNDYGGANVDRKSTTGTSHRTLANGIQELVASVDNKEYTITEASIRSQLQFADATREHVPLLPVMLAGAAEDQGEGSAILAKPHHTPIDPIPSTS